MKLGFVILSFKAPDRLFEMFLDRLREIPGAEIALHHDYSQSQMPASFVRKYNLHETPRSYVTKWSHINNVLATLDGFETLYCLDSPPDWYITVTPNCYPIKRAAEIVKFYQNSSFNAYLQMRKISIRNPETLIDRYVVRDLKKKKVSIPFVNKKLNISRKELFFPRNSGVIPFADEGYELWHGSNWLSLDKKIIGRIIESDLKSHITTNYYLIHYSQNKDMHPCPQEIVIPSFVGNQKDLNVCNNYYRYIDWNEHKNWHPNVLTETDFSDIEVSEALWARKFEFPESRGLVELIDKHLLD